MRVYPTSTSFFEAIKVDEIEDRPSQPQTGRPPHVPTEQTRQMVSLMVAAGIPHEQIAPCIGIHWQTLTKHYAEEIATAATRANAKVAGSLYRKATGEHPQAVTAAIWWTKSRMGWKGTDVNEQTGPNGGPQQHEHVHKVDVKTLSDEDLELIERLGRPREVR